MRIRRSSSHPRALGLLGLLALLSCSDPTEPSDQPAILLVNPRGVAPGTGPFQMAVYGENFGPGSTLLWNGEPRPSSATGTNIVYAAIAGSDVENDGTVNLSVRREDGKVSRPVRFTIDQYLEPTMTMSSVSPAQGTAGAGDTEVTVIGTGFVPGTVLFLDFTALETTVISATTLRAVVPAAYLQTNNSLPLRLGVPGVWVGISTLTWAVVAPPPVITSLTPAGAATGDDDLELHILGTGFTQTSVVRVLGTVRSSTFVSGSELKVTLTSTDLASARTLAITVETPAPGGGVSPAANFAVTDQAPELAPLPLLGVTAGRPGFTLVVQGSHFAAGTVVQWNGSDRSTLFRSGRRLFATIPAADIASPGQATITVRTPGFPVSAPQTLTIHPVPASTVTDIRSVAFPARWLTVDPGSGRFFVTVPGSVATYGNTVSEIDPNTGSVLTSVFVGSEPSVAEVSDDGQYLYVGIDGAQAVRRVDLPSLTPGLQFSLGALQVEELHVMPAHPHTVAVSRRNPGSSPSNSGLVIYDDGVARPLMGPGHTGSNTFGWIRDATAIFGFNFESTEFGLRRVNVGPEGATEVWVQSGLIDGFFGRIQVVGDQIYGGDGSVVDGDLRQRLGSCAMAGWLAVDRELGRAFYWADATIKVCDLATFQSLGSITVPGVVSPHPAERHNLIRWGADGLAFSDGQKIYLVRTPLAAP